MKDDHNYPDPVSTGATATRASVVGEYGGIGMWLDGHNTVSRGDAADRPGNGPYVDNSTMFQVRHIITDLLVNLRRLFEGLWLIRAADLSAAKAAKLPVLTVCHVLEQEKFLKHLATLKDLIHGSTGVSAAIYTQLTDVETEPNGIMSYDRKVHHFKTSSNLHHSFMNDDIRGKWSECLEIRWSSTLTFLLLICR